jgi:hypothetical protein
MNTFWGQMGIELLGGVIGSFIFLWIVLLMLRPHIKIGDKIAKQANIFDGESEFTFLFKIINCSIYDAFEIELELFEVYMFPAFPSGTNSRLTAIELKRKQLRQIPRWRKIKKKNAHLADHCVSFRTNVDLEKILKDESKSLQLQITLKHGLTGLSRVYRVNYPSKRCIQEGEFRFGHSFEVN